MQPQAAELTIPDDLEFTDLDLARDPDGNVSLDWSVIERICEASDVPVEMLRDASEDIVAELIVVWYQAHLLKGGERDPVAEDLNAEAAALEKSGQPFSYPTGWA